MPFTCDEILERFTKVVLEDYPGSIINDTDNTPTYIPRLSLLRLIPPDSAILDVSFVIEQTIIYLMEQLPQVELDYKETILKWKVVIVPLALQPDILHLQVLVGI